ncbi:ATP synthase gamma subunit, putative [Ichthyophthirius multifiliis]|uniref:ATP synthase subunit gamma n=1 Tax=Ichthyophthirius multifiliis TaxID=5932 RepID=G0QRK2_ICHMU|nr:ATP synthase gamma subunit, putative [Ichthyophthirius multifiliis]EGR32156.1 ATP synthase gamma subunit, putative [Ichthyophthirius multifiliis]|eukprot:XP_004035642.1 ATP synthase gamma subunit, putative [Ichthyophthirius multifiliis]
MFGKTFKNLTTSSLYFTPQMNFGANLKQLKIRMKAIGSIKKITKAMKMVAAAKMKSEVSRLEKGRNFALGSVSRVLENEPYVQKKKSTTTPKTTLLVPFTSDRGLCGSINSSVVRDIKRTVPLNRSSYGIFSIGEKGTIGLTRPFPDLLLQAITGIAIPINFPTAASIAHQIVNQSTSFDNIILIFNRFKNVISQQIIHQEVLNRAAFFNQFKYVTKHEAAEPDLEYSKNYFYELYVASSVYNALLNSSASEQASRMNAMENASKNAGEILNNLTLQYNRARQTKITMELIEIISGASAL